MIQYHKKYKVSKIGGLIEMFWTEWTFYGLVAGGTSLSYALLLVALNVERIAVSWRERLDGSSRLDRD